MSRTKRLTEMEKMQIVREAAEGVSTTDLATQFGVTARAVRYILKADAEREADAAIPVSAVSVKVTAAELADSLGNMRRELAVRNRQAACSKQQRGWTSRPIAIVVWMRRPQETQRRLPVAGTHVA